MQREGAAVAAPMLAGPDGDAPAILGPAGTVHLSVLDFRDLGSLELR
jgi:hypothetical protein